MYSSAPLQTLQWQATIRHGPEAPYLEKRICCPDRSTGLHGTGYLVLSEIVPVIKRRPLYDIDDLNFSGLELCLQVARGWNVPANFGSVWNRCDRPTWYSSVRGYTTLRHFRLSRNMWKGEKKRQRKTGEVKTDAIYDGCFARSRSCSADQFKEKLDTIPARFISSQRNQSLYNTPISILYT